MPTAVSQRRARCVGVERRRRRLLDELLEAPLYGALALSQMDVRAVTIGQHLHFDVARALDVALDVDPAILEAALGLAARRLELARPGASAERTMRMPRPPPPAAALISTGKPIARTRSANCRRAPVLGRRRGDRKSRARDALAGADLVAHEADHFGGRADEAQARGLDRGGEVGVLGEKAVARVNRVGARSRARRRGSPRRRGRRRRRSARRSRRLRPPRGRPGRAASEAW